MIEPGSDPALGIASAGALDKKLAYRRLMSLVRSTAYEGARPPRLARLMDEFLGCLTYLHKRNIMWFIFARDANGHPGTTIWYTCGAEQAAS